MYYFNTNWSSTRGNGFVNRRIYMGLSFRKKNEEDIKIEILNRLPYSKIKIIQKFKKIFITK